MVTTSPEEAYRKYDELTSKHIEQLRKLTKAIQDARIARDNDQIKQSLKEYDEALERCVTRRARKAGGEGGGGKRARDETRRRKRRVSLVSSSDGAR